MQSEAPMTIQTAEPARAALHDDARARRAFDSELVALLPRLRQFAFRLSANSALADDLVQETCVNAIAHATTFIAGTNMRAWLFTILRNCFYSRIRKHRREVEDAGGKFAAAVSADPAQEPGADLSDVMDALSRMPRKQRDVLMAIGRDGLSYEETARHTGCAVGTIKSRTHRARLHLKALMGVSHEVALH